jgi:hypothetical protein
MNIGVGWVAIAIVNDGSGRFCEALMWENGDWNVCGEFESTVVFRAAWLTERAKRGAHNAKRAC